MDPKVYIARARLGISAAAVFLILGGLMALLESLIGGVAAGGAAVLAAAATWYCNRRASQAATAHWTFYVWRLLPLVAFVLGPYAWRLWSASSEGLLWTFVFEWLSPALAYLIPMSLLILADWQLRLALRTPAERAHQSEQLPFAQ